MSSPVYAGAGVEIKVETVDASLPEAIIEEGRRIKRKDLVNLLNFLNFREGTIFVSFRHRKYGNLLTFKAVPQPCDDDKVECRWSPPGISTTALKPYALDHFFLSDGRNLVVVNPEVVRLDSAGAVFRIPDFGYEKKCRNVRRNACEGVDVEFLQNGLSYTGTLVDFSAAAFRVELSNSGGLPFRLINPDLPALIIFRRDGGIVYSGECVVVRQGISEARRSFVLAPNSGNLRRFKAREFRCLRHRLTPTPNVNFLHPLTGRRVNLQLVDLSSSGFSVEEFYDNSVLLPGLIVAEASLEIANHFIIRFSAQVLYRNIIRTENGESVVKCGFVFLDLELEDQTRLSALLHQSMNRNSYVCNQVDVDELWKFFFESGFIYPSKYAAMKTNKEEFKRTYEKLYLRNPSIARHFVFQDKGTLFGHMSMIRYYSNAWLIHHHAASRDGHGMAGVSVLDQVGYYVNEFSSHHSTHMDYVMCYYRPDNRFPSRVFGGVAREIATPKGSSLDTFAYFHLGEDDAASVEQPFQLYPVHEKDLEELERCYESVSSGLMLDALDLKADSDAGEDLSREFSLLGFRRERHVFSLQKDDSLKAVIMVTVSDMGLNLSNLTNCIHVIVVDGEGLPPALLRSCLSHLRRRFRQTDFPVLVYPVDYMEENEMPYEKKYTLWVLNMRHLDGYFRAMDTIFKRVKHDS